MDRILVGKIVNTHGIKGELKILSETDFTKERFHENAILFIDLNGEWIEVKAKAIRPHKGFDLLSLKGLEDINLVEKYVGCMIYSENKRINNLKINEFQLDQLMNLVVLQKGKVIGSVSGIRVYPQGDYLEVTPLTGKTALIPFRDEFIVSIDEMKKTIEIVDMEGLL